MIFHNYCYRIIFLLGICIFSNNAIAQVSYPVTSFIDVDESAPVTFSQELFSSNFNGLDELEKVKITSLPCGRLELEGNATAVGETIDKERLNDLVYIPEADCSASDSFSWQGSNDGNSYTETEANVNIIIHSAVLVPVLKDGYANVGITFNAREFIGNFADDRGRLLEGIKVISLPEYGELLLSGTLVTVNQEIGVEYLDDLSYMPDQDFIGRDSFSWSGFNGDSYTAGAINVNVEIVEQAVVMSFNWLPLTAATAVGVAAPYVGSGMWRWFYKCFHPRASRKVHPTEPSLLGGDSPRAKKPSGAVRRKSLPKNLLGVATIVSPIVQDPVISGGMLSVVPVSGDSSRGLRRHSMSLERVAPDDFVPLLLGAVPVIPLSPSPVVMRVAGTQTSIVVGRTDEATQVRVVGRTDTATQTIMVSDESPVASERDTSQVVADGLPQDVSQQLPSANVTVSITPVSAGSPDGKCLREESPPLVVESGRSSPPVNASSVVADSQGDVLFTPHPPRREVNPPASTVKPPARSFLGKKFVSPEQKDRDMRKRVLRARSILHVAPNTDTLTKVERIHRLAKREPSTPEQ
jgi:hypothetical protein